MDKSKSHAKEKWHQNNLQIQDFHKLVNLFQVINEKEIGNMTKRADQLRDYLRGSKLPTDKMDAIFIGRIVDRLSHYVQDNDRVNLLSFQARFLFKILFQ